MTTATLPRTATRHECSLRFDLPSARHTAGSGMPRRQKCAYCGGHLAVRTGWYGVFVHSSFSNAGPSGARYAIEDAVSLHSREASAGKVVGEDATGTLVTRWVTA